MATTLTHRGCPKGSLATWRGALKEGNCAAVYVRESYVKDVDMGTWVRRETVRRWVRVGTVCLDCQAFVFGKDYLPDARAKVDHADPEGIPSAAATGIPSPSRSI